jgi:hypothetical protein
VTFAAGVIAGVIWTVVAELLVVVVAWRIMTRRRPDSPEEGD